jgi:hypothetical protein
MTGIRHDIPWFACVTGVAWQQPTWWYVMLILRCYLLTLCKEPLLWVVSFARVMLNILFGYGNFKGTVRKAK